MVTSIDPSFSAAKLRAAAHDKGKRGMVKANIRLLIDKLLARYSTDFVVCRELIQNADDAQATWFLFEIKCQSFNNHNLSSSPEISFHKSYITEIAASNNGHPFTETDWKRVTIIGEGNTDADSVGRFGVGFFSVFSLCHDPVIISGNQSMQFIWQDDCLTTPIHTLSDQRSSQTTSVKLKIQKKFILFTDSTKTSNTEDESVFTLKLIELKTYFAKVLSFTKHINEIVIKINDLAVFRIQKTKQSIPMRNEKLKFELKRSVHNILCFQSFVQSKQTFTIADGPSLTLDHVSVKASVIVSDVFQQHVRQILKKTLPSTIHIELLFGPYSSLANNDILGSLIPLKLQHDQIIPAGHIFIGLGTQQSTGIGMHIYSHFIPTVERENLDFQDPKLSEWNKELLLSAGQIARFIYDQAMSHISSNTTIQDIQLSLSPFSFQSTAPQNKIGDAIQSGFFYSTTDLLVPVRQSPSDSHISLVPSQQTCLTQSKDIETFLSLLIVPFELSKSKFFVTLRERRLIGMVNTEIIEQIIPKIVLSLDELINLIHWLCKNEGSVKSIFEYIRYRESANSNEVTLTNIQYYITKLRISSNLPLPSTVLPRNVTNHFSMEQLNQKLSLSEYPLKSLIKFYLLQNQSHLLKDPHKSAYILSLISQNLNLFSDDEWNEIKLTLSKIKCIPTSHGMKLPSESYIPSSILSSSVLPIIHLKLVIEIPETNGGNKGQLIDDMENGVTSEFLKNIGCHTFHLQSFLDARSFQTSGDMKKVIQQLIEKRKHMTEADFDSLKNTKWLQGKRNFDGAPVQQYAPHKLHFPSVANEFGWLDLRVVNYHDIQPNSPEYNFLKDLGVREVPELQLLINHIVEEHNEKTSEEIIAANYDLPKSFSLLIKQFVLHYRKSWNRTFEQIHFVPSFYSSKSNHVILLQPNEVFTDDNPLCSVLLPQVVKLFQKYSVQLSLLGIKQYPDIEVAFSLMLKRKDEFLMNKKSASIIFGYLCKIYQWNKAFNEKISIINFIPLQDYYSKKIILKKPTEVFVHRNKSETEENINTEGLIDYVDFGEEGNRFLENIGVKAEPSITHLAELILDRQANYFNEADNNDADLFMKYGIYIGCLRHFAKNILKLEGEGIKTRLRNEAWCVGCQCIVTKDGSEEQVWKILKPTEVYINNHDICAKKFQPICAPMDGLLAILYSSFGAKYLDGCCTEEYIPTGEVIKTSRSRNLCKEIVKRLDILFIDNRGKNRPNLINTNVNLLRHLSVYEVDYCQHQLTFEERTVTLDSNESNSYVVIAKDDKAILHLRKADEDIIYYSVAVALARFVFGKEIYADSISDHLLLSYEELKRRGIPGDLLDDEPRIIVQSSSSEQPLAPVRQTENPPISNGTTFGSKIKFDPRSFLLCLLAPFALCRRKVSDESDLFNRIEDTSNQLDNDKNDLNQLYNGKTDFSELDNGRNDITRLSENKYEPKQSFHDEDKRKLIVNDIGKQKQLADKDCATYHRKQEKRVTRAIQQVQSYTKARYAEQQYTREEYNLMGEENLGIDMIRYKHSFHSILLYFDTTLDESKIMTEQALQLSWLLSNLAHHVFHIPVTTLHLFQDLNGNIDQFFRKGSLFFNVRYFKEVFADKIKLFLHSSSTDDSAVHEVINYYFIAICDGLAHAMSLKYPAPLYHNIQNIAVHFMNKNDLFRTQFSFQNYET